MSINNLLPLFLLLITFISFSSPLTTSPGLWHHHHHSNHHTYKCTTGDCQNGQHAIHHDQHGKYVGHYKHGQIISGRGIHTHHKKGDYYRGHFQEGKYHGIGVLHRGSTTYHGKYSNGILSGPVTTTLRNGTRWSSHYHNSTPWSGQTRWPWCIDQSRKDCLEHSVYIGHWKRGQPNGYGIVFNGTHRYDGHFVNGRFNGHGILHIKNILRYDGDFQIGMKHGTGILYDLIKHEKYSGEFQNDFKHGYGYTKIPGYLYGFYIYKNYWIRDQKMKNLPHNEL